VLLPAHAPSQPLFSDKSLRVSYDDLFLDFTVSNPATSLCQGDSNIGKLPVLVTNSKTGIQYHFADSVAASTLSIYGPGASSVYQICDFSRFPGIGVNNNCLLNSTIFNPHSYYAMWHTDGFQTIILPGAVIPGAQPVAVPPIIGGNSGPLTFWVDLNALGQSPQTSSMDAILRSVEAYIHRMLIDNLTAIATYTFIQDPGNVNLMVVNKNGKTTGRLPDGRVTIDIPGSFYFPSDINPGVILTNGANHGVFQILLHGKSTGSYSLAVFTTYPNGPIPLDTFGGVIEQNLMLGYRVAIDSTSAQQITVPTSVTVGDLNGDGVVDCKDVAVIKSVLGMRTGQVGFNAWADMNSDGIVDIRDLALVSQHLPTGTRCQ